MGWPMAKPLPKPSHRRAPVSEGVRASRTPNGVWVIVGMAVFFVIGGLGISAFVVWKSIGNQAPVRVVHESAVETVHPVSSSSASAAGEVGVEHPSANPMIDEAGAAPRVVNDRAEEDRMRQEVLKRIDLMRVADRWRERQIVCASRAGPGFYQDSHPPFHPK